jgi:hypothetical protein
MRLKALMLGSFMILALLAVIALAVNWDEPESQTVDEMLNSGETPYYTPSATPPLTPQEARAQYMNSLQPQAPITPAPTQVSTVPAAESTLPVKGTWSLQLLGENPEEASVTLYQSGDAIFGNGSVSQGNIWSEAAASGYVKDDQMSLDITTLRNITLYRATLTLSSDSASGSYHAFSATGDSWVGDITALRSA